MYRYLYICSALASLGLAHGDELSISVGQDFSEGNYGAESESPIGVTSFGARLRLGEWAFRASTGYIDLGEDPNSVITGPRGRSVMLPVGEAIEGFTDLSLGVTGPLARETKNRPAVTFSGSIKLPTADEEQGLGTGATDFGATVELSKTLGPFIAYSYLGGRLRGESEITDVQNSVNGGIGLQRPFGEKWVASVGYDYRGASFVSGEDAHEVTALVSHQLTQGTNLSVYAYTGFTDVSPDLGVGVFVSQRIASW